MKRVLIGVFALIGCASILLLRPLYSQGPMVTNLPTRIIHFSGAPSGSCNGAQLAENDSTGGLFNCKNGSWNPVGGGAGAGVASLTGDGTIFDNSASTGAVTLHLANTPLGSGGVVLASALPGTSVPFITTGSNNTVSTSSLFSVTPNRVTIEGLSNPYTRTSTKVCYEIAGTADNTSATYDIGIYTGVAGGTGTLIANIGPTAGTTFAPSTTTFKCLNWTQGTVTIPAGRIYIAQTTSQTVTAALIFGAATGNTFCCSAIQAITTGGTLPSTITLAADSNSGAGFSSNSVPWFSIQ